MRVPAEHLSARQRGLDVLYLLNLGKGDLHPCVYRLTPRWLQRPDFSNPCGVLLLTPAGCIAPGRRNNRHARCYRRSCGNVRTRDVELSQNNCRGSSQPQHANREQHEGNEDFHKCATAGIFHAAMIAPSQ
jgi:hypothetical protein